MKKQTIGHQRLIKLATFLYRVPRNQFNTEQWASAGFDARNPTCGTTACAIGWATTIFKDEGFFLSPFCTLVGAQPLIPHYKSKVNWKAVVSFFQISDYDAFKLFSPKRSSNHGPRQVAKDIKHFLKTKKVITTEG